MADAFISYSRKDQAFGTRLFTRLTQQQRTAWTIDELSAEKREVWIDWDAIPPSADWLHEIFTAIEEHDSFIFVISPDSIASPTCAQEVEHAVALNKRIIPVVYRHVDAQAVMEPVRALNWIYMRESDDFEAGFARLTLALDTDLDYWHKAADVLVGARKWEDKGKDPSLALRGVALNEAEQWLTHGATKRPPPTALQVEYVTFSQSEATRQQRRVVAQQRRFITVLVSGIAVALILAASTSIGFGVAQTQRTLAVHNAATAVANQQLALSRQLAAQSVTEQTDQTDLSLLLGVESYRVAPTTEAVDSVLGALEHNPRLRGLLAVPDSGVGAYMAVSPDGALLAWPVLPPSGNLTIILYDTRTYQPVGPPLTGSDASHGQLEFSPDGRFLALGDAGASLRVWDLATHDIVGTTLSMPAGADFSVYSWAFSPDSHYLAWVSDTLNIAVYDLVRHASMGGPLANADLLAPGPPRLVGSPQLQFGPDSTSIMLAALSLGPNNKNRGNVVVWNLARHQRVRQAQVSDVGRVSEYALAPDGTQLAVATCPDVAPNHDGQSCLIGQVDLWDVATGAAAGAPFDVGSSKGVTGYGLLFSPDSKLLAVSDDAGTLTIWIAATRQLRDSLRIGSAATDVADVAFSSDGTTLAAAYGTQAAIWNMASVQPVATTVVPQAAGSGGSVSGGVLSLNGKMVALFQQAMTVWDTATGHARGQPQADVQSAAFSPDGQTMAVGRCIQYDADSLCTQAQVGLQMIGQSSLLGQAFTGSFQTISNLVFNPDGSILAASVDQGTGTQMQIALWTVATRQPLAIALGGSAPVLPVSLAFSPNGQELAGGGCYAVSGQGCAEEVHLWNIHTGRLVRAFVPPRHQAAGQLSFSRDGTRLVLEGLDDSDTAHATVLDVATGRVVDQPPVDHITSVALSPDGQTLALGSCQAIQDVAGGCFTPTIQLWDVATNRAIGQALSDQSPTIPSLAFTPDGMHLVSVGDGAELVLIWDVSAQAWVDRACHIANRELTKAEWLQYVGTTAYHKTC